jgi:hypothetical protein
VELSAAVTEIIEGIISERAADLRQQIEAFEAAEAEAGIPALRVTEDATREAWIALVDKIIVTPAQSFAGIAVKLLIARPAFWFSRTVPLRR